MALDDKNMTGNNASGGMSGQAGTNESLSGSNAGMGTAGGHSSSGASNTGMTGNTGNLNSPIEGNASSLNWEEEDRYWSENYGTRPYANQQTDYPRIRPAYQYGASAYHQNEGRRFDELDENTLRSGWESQNRNQMQSSENASMGWEHVKEAVKDAYNRMFDRQGSGSGNTATRSARARQEELV
jgi:hypothetical protein